MCKQVTICEPRWTKVDNIRGPIKTDQGDVFLLRDSDEYFWGDSIAEIGEDFSAIEGFDRLMKISCVLALNSIGADELKGYVIQNKVKERIGI